MLEEKGEEPAGSRNKGVKEQDRRERGVGAKERDERDPKSGWEAGDIRVGGLEAWKRWRLDLGGGQTRGRGWGKWRPGQEAGRGWEARPRVF